MCSMVKTDTKVKSERNNTISLGPGEMMGGNVISFRACLQLLETFKQTFAHRLGPFLPKLNLFIPNLALN
jgi:hypothetical protein